MTPEEAIAKLRPRYEIWHDPRVKDWLKDGDAEIDELIKLGMSITKASAIRNGFHAHILEKLGIEPPQTSEDAYQIWLTLRSVVNFWRWKLDQLKTQSNEYEKLMEKNLNA